LGIRREEEDGEGIGRRRGEEEKSRRGIREYSIIYNI